MKRSIHYFLRYFLFWFLYFFAFKIIFLIANIGSSMTLGWKDLFGVFLWGVRMDLSAAGYLTVLPGILMALSPLFHLEHIEKIIRYYTFVLLLPVTMMGILDFGLFPAWGCRLNGQIIPYLGNPAEMAASLNLMQWGIVVFGEVGLVLLSFRLYKRFFPIISGRRKPESLKKMTVFLLMTGALILPIRGSIDTSPLNFSSVCFSQNLFANQAACNYFWSFSYALLNNKTNSNPVHYMDLKSAEKALSGVEALSQFSAPKYIHSKDHQPINVILVILESFSNKVIEPLGGLKGITPRINGFCKEGLVFSSFYSTGNRSDKGISSLLASYPAVLRASSVMLYPDKMKHLDLLPAYFAEHDYDRSFYYGGDPDFYNQKMLVMQSGIRKMVSRNSFPLNVSTLQKWGAPDAYVFDRAFKDLDKKMKPYFSIIYTLSSHEPFDIPNYEKIPGSGGREKYLNAVSYTDQSLGAFIDKLKNRPNWKNTLVIITADHTSREPGPTTVEEPATYRIPMLWIGGVVDSVKTIQTICMQTDLTPTLVQQLGWKPKPSMFAKNIFGPRPFAFYFRDDGWGFLSSGIGFFENLESKQQTLFYLNNPARKDSLIHFAKGFTQYLHHDFMKR
ncbi:MAG TPA: LTA synthase family protein [Bacteroidales bacterium]|nr:LTA synthase family protein [Bacteroidales bacterium]